MTHSYEQLVQENIDLRAKLDEVEETLRAIHSGEVDALIISTSQGNEVFTLQGADQPYRILIEEMHQGAITILLDGIILYSNRCFAEIVSYPLEGMLSHSIYQHVIPEDRQRFTEFIQAAQSSDGINGEFTLRNQQAEPIPVLISANTLQFNQLLSLGLVVTDLRERKRAEGEFARLASIVTSSNDAIIGETLDGIITSWNRGAERVFGYSAHEVIQKPITILMPPEKASEATVLIQKVVAGEIVENFDTIRLKKDGKEIFVSVSISPIKDHTGDIVGISKIAQDVTERKQAEEKISASEMRYRHLFEAAKDGIIILDAYNGQLLDANPYLLELLGYSLKDLLGKELWQIGLFQDIAASQMAFRELQDKGYIRYEDLPLKTQDGRNINVEFVSNVYQVNAEKVIQCNIRDITERKRAEELIEQERRLMRTLIDSIPDRIYAKDNEGRFTLKNEADARQMGATSTTEVIGKTDFDYYPSELAAHYSTDDQSVIQLGQSLINREEPFLDAAGNLGWMLTTKVPLRDKQEQVIGLVGIGRDITDRKRAEEKLAKLNRSLALISSVNQSIVRIRHLSDLFETVCRIAVEIGGFQMAWIGLLDSATMRVNPVAHAGIAENYLEMLDIVLDDKPRGKGPTAAAMLTGGAVIVNDIEHDPRMAPWRKDALRLGYRASAVFPLNVAGEMHGVLNLYSKQAGFFDAEELNQLDEMVADISFAMEFAEKEAQRQQALAVLKQHIQAVEAMRLFLQTTLDAFPANTVVLDPNGTIINVNASWIRFADDNSAPSPMHYLGANYLSVCDTAAGSWSEEAASAAAGIRAVINGSQDECYIEYPCHSATEIRWFALRVTPFPEPAPHHVVVAHINISARKQAEENLQKLYSELETRITVRTAELQLSKERVEAILNSSADAILLLKGDFSIQQTNASFNSLFGCEQDDYLGKSLNALLDNRDTDIMDRLLQAAAKQSRLAMDVLAWRKDNTVFAAELSIGFIRDDSFVCTFHDISERKRVEQSLHIAVKKEQELNELKTRFVSMASHEFRTPLATIHAFTETLSAYRHKLSEDQIDLKLNSIRGQVKYLKDIMDDMLKLAQLQMRRAAFVPETVDFDALCREVIEEAQNGTDIDHTILYTCTSGLPTTQLDKKLMRQLVSNLLSNAIKYSPQDKTIVFNLEYTPTRFVLSVIDRGIGIPEDDLKHLFEPFHRAANVGTIHGTGLGLVIAKESVELHGGTITVESYISKGTTITVHIPINAESVESAHEAYER